MKKAYYIIRFIVSIVITPLFFGIILMTYWEWFIVPIFKVEIISSISAVGIVFFLKFLVYVCSEHDFKDECGNDITRLKRLFSYHLNTYGYRLKRNLYSGLIYLLIGWIIHFFV